MDEGGALKGVAGPFLAQLKVGQPVQFLVDKWQKRVERLAVSIPPPLQK
jgi:hypothetical protein